MSEILPLIAALAREAGAMQRAKFNGALTIDHKDHATDLVTEVDRAVDGWLTAALRRHFPAHAVVSEEGDRQASTAEHVWYVDPLDGTTNYAHGYPVFAVSIALWRGGEPALGVVYDASRDELFSAERGAGAFLNGERLRVSRTAALDQAVVATGFPYDRATHPDNNFAEFARVTRRAQGVRRGGAAAIDLAYVAAGRLDGHWERGLNPWDCAAGALLVVEAGGQLSNLQGQPWSLAERWMVATNGLIHNELVAVLIGA
ncbi:MAG: inositol monophosphatase [Chloroflexi bacterium]|nr:inositol monophosphatase [Chloroflexota bacterium]